MNPENKNRFTLTGFIVQTLTNFSIMVLFITAIGQLVGNEAAELSSLFQLGSQGLAAATIAQILFCSLLVSGARFLWFSEWAARRLNARLCVVLMLLTIFSLTSLCVILFGWFPANFWDGWLIFITTFLIFFCLSYFIASIKTRRDNERYARLLADYKLRQQQKEANQ